MLTVVGDDDFGKSLANVLLQGVRPSVEDRTMCFGGRYGIHVIFGIGYDKNVHALFIEKRFLLLYRLKISLHMHDHHRDYILEFPDPLPENIIPSAAIDLKAFKSSDDHVNTIFQAVAAIISPNVRLKISAVVGGKIEFVLSIGDFSITALINAEEISSYFVPVSQATSGA